MIDWIFTFLVILVAAMIQSGTGFGFAIIAIPLLLLAHDVHYVVPLTILLSLLSSVSILPRIRKEIDRDLLRRLFIGSILGMPLGGFLFYLVDVFWLKIMVSITIVLFTLLLMFRVTLPLGSGKRIGFLSGFMTSSIGMPGPPVVLYLASKNTEKGAFRATSIAYYCLVYPISLLIQYASGHFGTDLIFYSLLMIPAIFIGQAAGSIIHNKISHKWFVRLTYTLLLSTAVNVLVQSL